VFLARLAVTHVTRTESPRMAALAEKPQTTRRLLLASDVEDEHSELANILQNAGSVETISIFDLPDHPASDFSGVVVDIDLTSIEAVQRVRKKLTGKAYQSMPRLFVLADALHHGSAQAWALGDKRPMTGTVQDWRARLPDVLPLPHPSPRNQIWERKNPWYGEEVLPFLKKQVEGAIG